MKTNEKKKKKKKKKAGKNNIRFLLRSPPNTERGVLFLGKMIFICKHTPAGKGKQRGAVVKKEKERKSQRESKGSEISGAKETTLHLFSVLCR